MNHIFVSYAHEDQKFARQLTSRLREDGKKPWHDLRNLRGGDDNWHALIDNALRNAKALIVVMSPHAAKSQYVTYEWAFALGAGIRVIPVVKRPTALHPRLSNIQYIDFTTRRGSPWVVLREALSKRRGRSPAARSKEQPPRPRRSATSSRPQIRARFNIVDRKPLKRGGYYEMAVYINKPPRGANQVTYELHDETLRRVKWPVRAAAADFALMIRSDGDSLLTATIRRPGKESLRIASSLYEALRRGHGSSPKPQIERVLREIRKSRTVK